MPYVLSVSDVVPSGIFDSIFPILQMGGVALGLILMVVGAFRLFSPDPFSVRGTPYGCDREHPHRCNPRMASVPPEPR